MALPSIPFGANVIPLEKTDTEELQRIENSVNRIITGANRSCHISAITVEVGTLLMEAQIMRGKLQHIQGILTQETNQAVRKPT